MKKLDENNPLNRRFKMYLLISIIFLILAIVGIGYLKSRYENSVNSAIENSIDAVN